MKKNKNYQKFYHLGTISATNDLMYHNGKVLGQDEPPVLFFSHSLETEIIIQEELNNVNNNKEIKLNKSSN